MFHTGRSGDCSSVFMDEYRKDVVLKARTFILVHDVSDPFQ